MIRYCIQQRTRENKAEIILNNTQDKFNIYYARILHGIVRAQHAHMVVAFMKKYSVFLAINEKIFYIIIRM